MTVQRSEQAVLSDVSRFASRWAHHFTIFILALAIETGGSESLGASDGWAHPLEPINLLKVTDPFIQFVKMTDR